MPVDLSDCQETKDAFAVSPIPVELGSEYPLWKVWTNRSFVNHGNILHLQCPVWSSLALVATKYLATEHLKCNYRSWK